MTVFIKLISLLGLVLTVVPALLVFARVIVWQTHAQLTLLGAVLWFATAPFWMRDAQR